MKESRRLKIRACIFRIADLIGQHPDSDQPCLSNRRAYAYAFFFGAKFSLITTGVLFWIEFWFHLIREACS